MDNNTRNVREPGAYLGQQEAAFRAVFEDAAIGITLVDLEGRPVKCNPALEKILGYTDQELCGMTFPEFTHPDDLQADMDLYRSLVSGQRDHYQIEKRYIRKDRQIVWARLTISLVHQHSKPPEFAVGMVEDITGQKAAQVALRESQAALHRSEERLRRGLAAARMGTWEWDFATGQVAWAGEIHSLFGLAPGEFGGTLEAFLNLVEAGDRARVQQELEEAIRDPSRKYYSELRVQWPDGSIHWLEGRGEVRRDSAGKSLAMVGTAVDVTDRKQAELALRASEESLRATIENTPNVAIQWFDEEGRVLFWNQASETVFGWRAGEAVGQTLDRLVLDAAEMRHFMETLNEVRLTGRTPPPAEYRFHRRDGTRGVGFSTIFRIRRDGDKFCFVCMDVDITERKQAEQSLREAQERELRAREEFTRQLFEAEEQERQRLAAELHDSLGQNLSIIKNNAYLALTQTGLPAAAIEHLNAVSQVASDTIAEVRDLVHNLRPLQIEKLGLTDSLRDLVDKVARSAPIQIESRIEAVDDVLLGSSATHVYRIVQEALNNLVKHSAATRACLSLERDVKCVRLRLSDNGSGFQPELAAHRAGFGLRNIAERAQMLGGSTRLESVPGTGTKLSVEVPIPGDVGPES